jgi:hypothetical protein
MPSSSWVVLSSSEALDAQCKTQHALLSSLPCMHDALVLLRPSCTCKHGSPSPTLHWALQAVNAAPVVPRATPRTHVSAYACHGSFQLYVQLHQQRTCCLAVCDVGRELVHVVCQQEGSIVDHPVGHSTQTLSFLLIPRGCTPHRRYRTHLRHPGCREPVAEPHR